MPFPTSSNRKAEGDNDVFSKDIGSGENRCWFTILEMLFPDASEICVVLLMLWQAGEEGRMFISEEMMRSLLAPDVANSSAVSIEGLTAISFMRIAS